MERWSRACSTDSFRGRLWRGPGANSSSALVSVLMADFGSTIRQASLLTPRVVIGSRNSSSPRSTTLHAGRANVAVAALGVEFRPLETDVFAHDCSSGRKVAVLRAGRRGRPKADLAAAGRAAVHRLLYRFSAAAGLVTRVGG